MRPEWWFRRVARPGRRIMPRGKGMDLIELIRGKFYTPIRSVWNKIIDI